ENVDDIVETDEHHEQEQIIAGPDTLTPLPPISSKKLWPRVAETGMIEVPIEIETDDYSPKQLDVFHEGLADIESKTCVRKIGGPQYLTLTPGCMKLKRKSVHEMIHILGFSHMHQRYDRDDYINIKWDNIVDKYKYAFKRYDNEWEAYVFMWAWAIVHSVDTLNVAFAHGPLCSNYV
ncbi:Astacin-like metalloendopeptidase, partial [Pseudolycoriella hygida]